MKRIMLVLFFLFIFNYANASEHFDTKDEVLDNRLENALVKVSNLFGYSTRISKCKVIVENLRIPCYVAYENILILNENLSDGIIYHEVAHVVLSQHTKYSLNETCQEVLAMWAEWELTK